MKHVPNSSFVEHMKSLGAPYGRKRWTDERGRFYEWDSLHGELEVYNSRGRHIGVVDPQSGKLIKEAVAGRKINV